MKGNGSIFDANGFNRCDKTMLSAALILITVGIVFVFSADNSALSLASKGVKQIVFSITAVFTAVLFTIIDHRKIGNEQFLKNVLIFLLIFLGILAIFATFKINLSYNGFGIWKINGAYRWIILGPISFQPSVFIKLFLIMFVSLKLSQISDRERRIKGKLLDTVTKNREIIIFSLLSVLLITAQPSNSVAMSVVFVILAVVGLKTAKTIAKIVTPIILATVVLFVLVWNFNANFRDRILEAGNHYQSRQALLTIGSGGLVGLGIGGGEAKYNRLPEIENDYIFAIIAEETGFIGAFLFIVAYAVFIFCGFRTAINAEAGFSKLLAFGLSANYAFAFLLHLFVNLGFISTGASLPFVSYGGTAVIADAVSLGILLNISSIKKYERIRL